MEQYSEGQKGAMLQTFFSGKTKKDSVLLPKGL